jgi:hypothetical protein
MKVNTFYLQHKISSKYKPITSSDSELFGRVVKDGAVKGESESRSLNKYSI